MRCPALLLGGFLIALAGRVAIGRPDVAQSAPAGLIFAACLLALCLAAGLRLHLSVRAVAIGLAGSVLLCAPAVVGALHGSAVLGGHRPAGSFTAWALVVSVVAIAEELFLRGALHDALTKWRNEGVAIAVGAVAFAGLHVPLYGWAVVPLDLAVGLWLGALRKASGTPAAPALTHTLADLAGWWLR